MTKKQQAIKDAYLKLISEEEFNKLEPDTNGWLFSSELLLLSVKGALLDFKEGKQLMARPKSLQGIENNNGWIAIESEDDLPKEESYMFVQDKEKTLDEYLIHIKCFHNTKYDINNYLKKYSHYQPIILPSKPHY